jgi:hypothetical protein
MRAEADEVTGRDRVQLGLDLQGVNEEPNGTTARRRVKGCSENRLLKGDEAAAHTETAKGL